MVPIIDSACGSRSMKTRHTWDMLSKSRDPLRSEWADRAPLEEFRDRRLRELVCHAGARVPYYRRRLAEAGIDCSRFGGLADLTRLPVSRKPDLQCLSAGQICAVDVDPARLITHETGGSTGQPLTVRRTFFEERTLNWLRWRAHIAAGASLRDRTAYLGYVSPICQRNVLADILAALNIGRRQIFDCLRPPEELLHEIAAYRPDALGGFASSLARLALVPRPELLAQVRPHLVISGGDLLIPQVRTLLRETFAAPVRDFYGADECNLVAWECPHAGVLHACDEGAIVEILDEQGRPVPPGGEGEVVCTALHSFAMPIIRYSLGDWAVRGPAACPCGNQLSVLSHLRGRHLDYFKLADGTLMHPYRVIELLYEPGMEWVGQYQLIQESATEVRLLVQPRRKVPPGCRARLEKSLRERCGRGTEAVLELVGSIPLTLRGKHRVAYSKLSGI
jgi:phenylacetate-CoA ligase